MRWAAPDRAAAGGCALRRSGSRAHLLGPQLSGFAVRIGAKASGNGDTVLPLCWKVSICALFHQRIKLEFKTLQNRQNKIGLSNCRRLSAY